MALVAGLFAASAPGQSAEVVADHVHPPGMAPHSHGADSDAGADEPQGHEDSEGLKLIAAQADPATEDNGSGCDDDAPERLYEVAAIGVDITQNLYLDHDPQGRMYVLEDDLPAVRAEEQANAAARKNAGPSAVTAGLQGDKIQPLSLRVLPGECLRIKLRNALPANESTGLHLHSAPLMVSGTDRPASSATAEATARPGATVTYEWQVGDDEAEGTHYFHGHGGLERVQTGHGLFGAVIVEPKGSVWRDPRTGQPVKSGWDAVIGSPNGTTFREYVLYYHEVGDELFQVLDKNDQPVPLVDPITTAYRPGGRALNYRSEPFMNRLALQKQLTGGAIDESLEYSSYAFGDPATPILRGYLGDPVKQRVLHAGPEVSHVHHVHGGGIRWRRDQGPEPLTFEQGLDKKPVLVPEVSDRTDSQAISPAETFDVVAECGSGGCQQSVGDFMYHCHVTHHYFAGMWGIWRVYNTLQDGPTSTDDMAPLPALKPETVAAAVTSAELIGRTVGAYEQKQPITAEGLADWVERQLPPRGVPRGYDASVFDWAREGNVYLNEPETTATWPAYRPRAPGSRRPLLFDPRTGKLAYPFLRPHLAKRPPFAPGHGPAGYLDTATTGHDPPPPGASPDSTCPAGTKPKEFVVNAMGVPVPLNEREKIIDSKGQLYVLRQQEDQVRNDPDMRVPLVIRTNATEDCVDMLVRNDLTDTADDPFNKIGVHVHFMQFDVQSSDGVNTGFNYEQTVRPFRLAGERIVGGAAAGATVLRVSGPDRFSPGALIGIGMERDREFEVSRVVGRAGVDGLVLDAPLKFEHGAGEYVSTEFVRYRWYPDVQFGTAFFHDHVNVIHSSKHGLFGAIVSEPPASTYHHPRTGEELLSGGIADIRTQSKVSPDLTGSFRELLMLLQDDVPLNQAGRSAGGAIGMRAEPLDRRGRDPARYFSSASLGDPETPLLEAYLGDPVVIRTLVGANNDIHSFHLDGHWFRREPFAKGSTPANTVGIGISERFDLVTTAGGPQKQPGDYLYYNGRTFKMREGSWGLLRVLDGSTPSSLLKLPGRESVPAPAPTVCAPGAQQRSFEVTAVEVPLPMLAGGPGRIFVLDKDKGAVVKGSRAPTPLVLHANVGDCLSIRLRNETAGGPVSLHADMLAFDPSTSGGVAAGKEPVQTVAVGEERVYEFYASPEVGETVAMLRDFGNVDKNPGLGLYGAVVVSPAGSTVKGDGWNVEVRPPDGSGRDPYRAFTLFMQEEDEGIGTHRMPYTVNVRGPAAINYTSAPLAERLGTGDPGSVFQTAVHGDPATPVLTAFVGDPVRINVLAPWMEQPQTFSVEGHRWPMLPGVSGTSLVSTTQILGLETRSLDLEGGAGGRDRIAGDYVYGVHRGSHREAGMWGILRVLPRDVDGPGGLRPIGSASERSPAPLIGGGAAFLVLALALVLTRRTTRRWRRSLTRL